MFVRPFATPDTRDLYDVCLRTADAGADATDLHHEPALPGHVWLGAYLALAPELAWVVDVGHGASVGYVVGAHDTRSFETRCERDWWPQLRALFPEGADGSGRTSADQALVRVIHRPYHAPPDIVAGHPSHLHIDLLPAAQGGGLGRALIDTLCTVLARRGSTGVFVSVAGGNARALGFYRHVGFVDLKAGDGAVWLGRRLL